MQKNGVFSLIWSFPHKSIVEIKKMSYSANESVLTNIYYKQQTKELNMTEIEKLKNIGQIVADTLVLMKEKAKSGMTSKELDEFGFEYLDKFGAKSAPKVTYNFPGYTCISINHRIAHGIPSETKLKKGDLINIDVSAELNGYFADTGASFAVPPQNTDYVHLCTATKEAFHWVAK